MLCEIYCEQFHQKKISFHDGLNVVLGSPTAENSIGKSTLMLIVDFAFGGDTYTNAKDIQKNIGDHSIGFKFCFDNKDFFFLRSFIDRNIVWTCDEIYNKIDSMSVADYCNWLSNQYGLNLHKLSFRDAVGRYLRAYGKDNYDENYPLHATSKEKGEKATTVLLKLFDRYKLIDDLETRAKESKENLQTFTKAQAHNYVAKITKKQFDKNEKEIQAKSEANEHLSKQLDSGLLDLDAEASERAIEIKRQLSHARRMRSKLNSQISTLDENAQYKFSDTTDTFTALTRFFPDANIQHIEEIEKFHNRISDIFHSELRAEKRAIEKQLADIAEVISSLEEELNGLIQNPNLSKIILQKHADTVREIDRMTRENEAYQKKKELKKIKDDDELSLSNAKGELFAVVEKTINAEMERINDLLYTEKRNAPIIHFENGKYRFYTPDDTGTGIAFKGLVVFDLAMLHLTKLPIVVHDSLILKQISDDAVENILLQYTACGKQVIIALDKQDSYSRKTYEELEKHTVLKLTSGGEELFGRSWSKKSKE